MFCQRCHSQPAVGFFDADGLWAELDESAEVTRKILRRQAAQAIKGEVVEDETGYCLTCKEYITAMSDERAREAQE